MTVNQKPVENVNKRVYTTQFDIFGFICSPLLVIVKKVAGAGLAPA
jgi:hypothetical protein